MAEALGSRPLSLLKGIACTTLLVVRGLTPGSCPGLSLCDERGASQSTGGGHTARLGHVTPRHEWPLGVVMVQPSQVIPSAVGVHVATLGRTASAVGMEVQELSRFGVDGARRAGHLLDCGAMPTVREF